MRGTKRGRGRGRNAVSQEKKKLSIYDIGGMKQTNKNKMLNPRKKNVKSEEKHLKKETKQITLSDQEKAQMDIVVDQAIKGVKLLAKQVQERKGKGKDLLEENEEDGLVYLQVGTVKVTNLLHEAKHIVRPVKLKVLMPNTLVNSNTEVLLIVKDQDGKSDIRDDHTDNLHYFEHMLRVCGAARHISEVVTLKQLKVEYKEYEAKRNLANRIDVVLCDATIIRRIPMFLGKHFYGKKKLPMRVNLKCKNLLSEIERVLAMQVLSLPMTGNSSLMKIGRLDQTDEMIKENIMAAVQIFQNKFPGGWGNIQSLSLKSGRSKSVPFYVKIRSANDVETIQPKPLTTRKAVTGELSIWYGDVFQVLPNNDIKHVKKGRRNFSDLMEEEEEGQMDNMGGEAPTKKMKISNAKTEETEAIVKELMKGESQKEKKKKSMEKSEDVTEATSSKTIKASKGKTNKRKKAKGDFDSVENEQLEEMEREYLKRISMEQENEKGDGKETNDGVELDDEEDDWAEISDEDDDMSGFKSDDEV